MLLAFDDLVDERKDAFLDELDQTLEHLRLAGKVPIQGRLTDLQPRGQGCGGDALRTAPPEPAIAVPVAAPASEPAAKPARSLRKALVMLSVPLLLVAGGAGWWLTGANRESTENAYLHQARISIAPTVGAASSRFTCMNCSM